MSKSKGGGGCGHHCILEDMEKEIVLQYNEDCHQYTTANKVSNSPYSQTQIKPFTTEVSNITKTTNNQTVARV